MGRAIMAAPTKTSTTAAEMRRLITDGDVPPGAFMPTESQLADQLGVSRDTVKAATARLVNEGLIERVPGNRGGMRVRERVVITHYMSRAELPDQPLSESDTFFAEVRAQGFVPSQEFGLRIVAVTAEVAERLEIDEGAPAVLRRCLRFVNDRPTSIQATYYPMWLAEQVPELLSPGDIAIGTTQLLRERGYDQVAYDDRYSARQPTPDEAIELRLSGGTAILEAVRIGYTMDTVVRVTVHTLAGDSNAIKTTSGSAEALKRATERAG